MAALKADDFVRLVTLYIPETVNSMAFSPDGSVLAVSAADKVHLYRVPDGVMRPGGDKPGSSPQ